MLRGEGNCSAPRLSSCNFGFSIQVSGTQSQRALASACPHACCWGLTEPKERDVPPHPPPERWRRLRPREGVQPLRKHRQHPEQGPSTLTGSASHVPRRPLQTFPNKAQGSSGFRGSVGLANGVARVLESGPSRSHA